MPSRSTFESLNRHDRTGGLSLRPAFLAVALLVLLALVAAGSRSQGSSRLGDAHERALPEAFWDYVLTLGVIVGLVMLVFVATLKVPLPKRRGRRFSGKQLFVLALALALIVLAAHRLELTPFGEGAGDSGVTNPPSPEATRLAEDADRDRSVQFQWPVLAAAVILAVLGTGAYYLRRRLGPGRLPTLDPASALSLALDESVDDLRAERDARRAVIAAYARMELALERHGLPRRAYEAPLEYLGRVLRELRVRSSSVLALTELFERAKFSCHEIDDEMKEEAIDALLAVRDDLRAEAAT
jgi:Domain of unknown function (DUF4129)